MSCSLRLSASDGDLDVAEVAPRLEGVFLDLVDGELEQRRARGWGLEARVGIRRWAQFAEP